ncbi:MAG: hypothetical protein QW039_01190 [Fervidicoccaceae archaeon]
MTYVILTSILNASLFLLNETRVDAYVSVNILIFYITYAIVKPFRNPGLPGRILQIVLLLIFAIMISYRVLEVLSK